MTASKGISVKRSADTATHFLTYQNPQTGSDDLLDCIPVEENRDGTMKVVVFSDDESSMVCVVDRERVLTGDDVTKKIVTDVLNDMIFSMPEDDTNRH